MTKSEELSNRLKKLDEDMLRYLQDYLLPVLKNTDFNDEDVIICFDAMSENPFDHKLSHIDSKGIPFIYCCDKKCRKIEVILENLDIDDLYNLIRTLEPYDK